MTITYGTALLTYDEKSVPVKPCMNTVDILELFIGVINCYGSS